MTAERRRFSTATHWGAYEAVVEDGRLVAIEPLAADPDPSPIAQNYIGLLDHPARIAQPMVRQGWLERGPRPGGGEGRGAEPFVAVSWERALDLLAAELTRVKLAHGNRAIFAGSYGWASAGRFHHAQGQIHRFLNQFGGYTKSVNAYSYAAAEVILPRIVGGLRPMLLAHTSWPVIVEHTRLVVAFGGMPLKNQQVNSGLTAIHKTRGWLEAAAANGCRFVLISPVREDLPEGIDAEWLRPRPNTDVALMLGIAHTLVAEGLHDREFLDRCTVGFERFRAYLTGETDGCPKDAGWAAAISGLDAGTIRQLARDMAATRTLVSASWSLQRQDHGEQPYWMAVTLAAMLGQIGLPGGGFGLGYAAMHGIGNPAHRVAWAALRQGTNPVRDYIPVARISDLLLKPGESFDYDGARMTYPDIRLVYWAGGNPFHHHQDINRLLAAWRRPETVVVHEIWWNALARHADIVLPVTTTLERNDLACTNYENWVVPMARAVEPPPGARSDHDIFAALAGRLGFAEAFTEGRDEMGWVRHLYDVSRQQAAERGLELPGFEDFWTGGALALPEPEPQVMLARFRADPERHPLSTPSGRIEIWSETIAGFGYDDCPGHPAWLEPMEWLGSAKATRFPLHLVSNQPRPRLHSQLDHGRVSRASKVQGREPMRIHPADAAPRGIRTGDVVRLFNDRGACLAGAIVTDAVMQGVVQLATGAWYDPLEPGVVGSLDKHGNANLLTPDKGTSRLAQGPIAMTCLVEVERWTGPVPPLTCHEPPEIRAETAC